MRAKIQTVAFEVVQFLNDVVFEMEEEDMGGKASWYSYTLVVHAPQ